MDAKQAEPWTAEENALNKIIPYAEMQPDALAEIANDAAEQAEKHGRKSVQSAIVAGEALAAARQQIQHGEWTAFVKTHWNYSQSWASRLMVVAKRASTHDLTDFKSVRQLMISFGVESERESDYGDTPEPAERAEPIEITASEPQEAPEPRQPSVSVKKPREPKEAPAERLAESEPFALGERLDADRTEILAMSGDYLIAKKLPHFVVMLRKVASDLEGKP